MNISNVAMQAFAGKYKRPTAIKTSKDTGNISMETLTNKEVLDTYDVAAAQIGMRNRLAVKMHDLFTKDPEVQQTLKTLPEEVEIECRPDFFLDDRFMDMPYAEKPLSLAECYLSTTSSGDKYPVDYDDYEMEYDETTSIDEVKNWLSSLPKAQGATNGAKVAMTPIEDITNAAMATTEELQNKKQIAEQLLEFFDSKDIQDLIASLPEDKSISVEFAACTPSENIDEDVVPRPEFNTPSVLCFDRTENDFIDFEDDIVKNGEINKQAIVDWLNSLKD